VRNCALALSARSTIFPSPDCFLSEVLRPRGCSFLPRMSPVPPPRRTKCRSDRIPPRALRRRAAPAFSPRGPSGRRSAGSARVRGIRAGELVLEPAAFGLAGLLRAMALRVELPPMVAVADATVLDLAIIERGAAVAAASGRARGRRGRLCREAGSGPRPVHELFRDVGGVGRKALGVPIAAEQLAHRAAADHRSQFGPGPSRLHRIGRAEIAVPPGVRGRWAGAQRAPARRLKPHGVRRAPCLDRPPDRAGRNAQG